MLSRHRPIRLLLGPHVRYSGSVRHRSRPHRLPRPPLPPPESTIALFGLLATISSIQLYANPVTGTFASSDFIVKHFETSRSRVKHGGAYTLVTSTLYTPAAGTALLNMLWLAISGRHVCRALGNSRFILLYVGSGTLANVVSLVSESEERDDLVSPRLQMVGGASCAVDAIVALNALLYPPSRVALTRRWMRWPLWFFSAMFLTRDEGERPPWALDSAPREGHLTGILCGLATFLLLRRPARYV